MQSQTPRTPGNDGDPALEGEDGLEVIELDLLCGRHVCDDGIENDGEVVERTEESSWRK